MRRNKSLHWVGFATGGLALLLLIATGPIPSSADPPALKESDSASSRAFVAVSKQSGAVSKQSGTSANASESVAEEKPGDSPVQFNRDVRPIFRRHCAACHGGVKQAADLSFVYERQALSVVEPGDPEESTLFERITAEDDEERMPPADHGPRLSAGEIRSIKQWIRQGAKWQEHWAFEAPRKTDPPATESTNWPRERIDHFILARLEQAELKPSPDASPERWLRRVSLDLIGLPPTLDQRAAFLHSFKEKGEVAYRDEVDRLLESPHFGERWASIWLDAVRYADSKGLGQDTRRTIWKYRDWVIKALNDDMPFDQFTIKQMAGDLLPEPEIDDLVATACHRLTQTNEEGGTDDEMFRVEAVIDRVNTTWQAWQGLTFGCVQCHSHPYDPIRHEEYYKFLAFFNSSADCDLGGIEEPVVNAPLDDADNEKAAKLDRRIAALRQREFLAGNELLQNRALWKPMTGLHAKTSNNTKVVVESRAGFEEYRTRGTVSQGTRITLEAPLPRNLDRVTAIRFTGLPLNPASGLKDSEWGFVLSYVQAELIPPSGEKPIPLKIARVLGDEPDPFLDPQRSLTEKDWGGYGPYSRIHYARRCAFVLDQPVEISSGTKIRVAMKFDGIALGAFPLVSRRGRLAVSDSPSLTRWLHDDEMGATRTELATVKKQREQIKSVPIPIMRERPAGFARPNYVFHRGKYLSKTQAVEVATPDFLPPLPRKNSPTRLDLAKWLVSPENPLTARVAVNRLWASMFGRGLVETQEDFGSSGAAPSHPKLLDDLAARFQTEMGWSTKRLLRELALSSTYRQSACVTAEQLDKDPRNRLLGRGSRKRLPAETVRDQTLALSGLLSDRQFGPPVHPPIPAGVWKPFSSGDKWKVPKKNNPNRYRRSVYTYMKRSIPYPMFATFDMPARDFCTARRLPSNTPLQALMTLNDATFAEANRALALRMLEAGENTEEQIRFGLLLATCREPKPTEVAALVQLYQTTTEQLAAEEFVQASPAAPDAGAASNSESGKVPDADSSAAPDTEPNKSSVAEPGKESSVDVEEISETESESEEPVTDKKTDGITKSAKQSRNSVTESGHSETEVAAMANVASVILNLDEVLCK